MDQDLLFKMKKLHYGDIHECPHAQMLLAARVLDKARRLVQLEYLGKVLEDFGDIPELKDRIGNLRHIEEDTIADLKGYLDRYEEGLK